MLLSTLPARGVAAAAELYEMSLRLEAGCLIEPDEIAPKARESALVLAEILGALPSDAGAVFAEEKARLDLRYPREGDDAHRAYLAALRRLTAADEALRLEPDSPEAEREYDVAEEGVRKTEPEAILPAL